MATGLLAVPMMSIISVENNFAAQLLGRVATFLPYRIDFSLSQGARYIYFSSLIERPARWSYYLLDVCLAYVMVILRILFYMIGCGLLVLVAE